MTSATEYTRNLREALWRLAGIATRWETPTAFRISHVRVAVRTGYVSIEDLVSDEIAVLGWDADAVISHLRQWLTPMELIGE